MRCRSRKPRAAGPTNRPRFQTRRPRSHSRSGPHPGGGLDKLDLDRKRAVIDVLLRVTILPGQRRGELRTGAAADYVEGAKNVARKVIWFIALKVIWSIVLMFFTSVVAALAGWLVASVACVLAGAVLRAATADFRSWPPHSAAWGISPAAPSPMPRSQRWKQKQRQQFLKLLFRCQGPRLLPTEDGASLRQVAVGRHVKSTSMSSSCC